MDPNAAATTTSKQTRDWQTIISDWKASGLSQRKFCQQRGLSDSGLSQAIKRSRSRQGFVKVDLPQRQPPVTVELPSGVRVSSNAVDMVDVVLRIMRGT
jgi:hypothetical protein